MNLTDVQTRVKRTFGDESGVQITDADIVRWTNDGQLDLVRRTKCNSTDITIPTLIGTRNYAIDRFLDAERVEFDGRPLRLATRQQVDQWYPTANASTTANSVPLYYIIKQSGIELFPPPDSVANIVVTYIKRPIDLVNGTDPLEIPVQYHEDVVRYALLRAYELDGQWTTVDRMKSDYDKRADQTKHDEENKGDESYPAIRCLPGDYGEVY